MKELISAIYALDEYELSSATISFTPSITFEASNVGGSARTARVVWLPIFAVYGYTIRDRTEVQ